MATDLEKPDFTTPNLLFETDASEWNDLSAEKYFSNLSGYLKNITIVISRPRLSDVLPLDRHAGLVWLITIPVAYFVVVGLILGVLLLCFWYVDRGGGVSPSQSESSVSTADMSSVKHDTAMKYMKRDTVVVSEVHDPLQQSIFRSFLLNTESHDVLRVSDSSKGSTRSLGVLTEKDLQVVHQVPAAMKSPGLTPTGRRQSVSAQGLPRLDMGVSDRKFDSRTFTKVRSSFRTALTSEVGLKMADGSLSSINDSSFSADSLEGKVTTDSLRTNMHLHKNVRAANGAIGPGDLYTCNRIIHDTYTRGIVDDAITNHKAESKTNRKFMFLNHMLTGKSMRDADEHLKETYEIALNADKLNFYYRTSDDFCSSSFFPSLHFPGDELSDVCRPELTPFRHAYTLNNETSEVVSETRPEHSIKNTGTNCQKIHLDSYLTPSCNTKAFNSNIKTRLFTSDCSVNDSQMSSAICTEDDAQYSNDRRRGNYLNNISLASIVLSGQPGSRRSSDHRKDNFQAPDVDIPDFDLSSVSQIAISSHEDFDNSRESPGSGAVRRDEGSFCSADNSLPSSIARFHASNVGQWPSPSAAYSLPSETDFESSRNECLCKDCRDKAISRSSLSVNFGSYSESTAAENRTAMPQDKSPSLSQNGTDCDQGSTKLDQGLVKLSKRPSPLSSLVNNIRQRYSLDENGLKSKREAPEEEEALLSSPLPQKEFGSKYNNQHYLDSKRKKVSVEERLQEYGFLKCKGKKYVINPSPGKYEKGTGYYNYVFTNSEDVCETPRYNQDPGNKENCVSQVNFSLNDSNDGGRFDGDSENLSKSQFSQCGEKSISGSQYSLCMEDGFYHFSRSRFNHGGVIPVTGTGSSVSQESLAVFEAHCGDSSTFSDIDRKQVESRVNQTATEMGHGVSSLSDHGDVYAFEKEYIDRAALEMNVGQTTFAMEFDASENNNLPYTGLAQAIIQSGIYEQREAGAFEKSQYFTYGESRNGTYTKSQNGTYRTCQNDTYGKSQHRSYKKHSNEMHETIQTCDRNHNEYYENAGTGTNEKPQTVKYEQTQQYVVSSMEVTKKSSSSDVGNLRSSWKTSAVREDNCVPSDVGNLRSSWKTSAVREDNCVPSDVGNLRSSWKNSAVREDNCVLSDVGNLRSSWKNSAVREDNCVPSMTAVGEAGEADRKLKRQYTSRTLLSLEHEASGHCEIQQDRRNGRLSSSRLYRFTAGNMQRVEATDSPIL